MAGSAYPKCFADHTNERVLITNHPTVARLLRVKGCELLARGVARRFTMPPGTHSQARGYSWLILDANWTWDGVS
jgi:hypothetical protein